MIGLAPRGGVRPWKIAAAVTALQRAFPGSEVWWDRASRHGNVYAFRVRGRGAVLVAPEQLARCLDEASVEALITTAVLELLRPESLVELTPDGRIVSTVSRRDEIPTASGRRDDALAMLFDARRFDGRPSSTPVPAPRPQWLEALIYEALR